MRKVLAVLFAGLFLLAGCNGSAGSPQAGTVSPVMADPTEDVKLTGHVLKVTPTLVPTETKIPTATLMATPTEIPTPTVTQELTSTPTEMVVEYFRARELVFADCRKFSGGPWEERPQFFEEYWAILRERAGSPHSQWAGEILYKSLVVTLTQYRDPNSEYCVVLSFADEFTYVEFVSGATGGTVLVPKGEGLLFYENSSGDFVSLKVQYSGDD